MIQMFMDALKEGKIMAVDWQNIDEMLGEAPKLEIECSICANDGNFLPIPEKTHSLRQEDVMKIIQRAGVQWVSFDFVNASPLSRFKTRYFAVSKPTAGQWLENPNK